MTFVQATTGSGGWPMSVWLTPDLKPFYGGTYFPPESRWGRPGFVDILGEIARVWGSEPEKVQGSADALTAQLRGVEQARRPTDLPGARALERTAASFREAFDRVNGGFGTAPKFPRPCELLFLFREYARSGNTDARDIALATLGAMAVRRHARSHRRRLPSLFGGRRVARAAFREDALRPGAARARVPRGRPGVRRSVLRRRRRGHAPVRPAPDDRRGGRLLFRRGRRQPAARGRGQGRRPRDRRARSICGARASWRALWARTSRSSRQRFGIEENGNAPVDPHGEFTGKNLLYLARSVEEIANELREDPDEVSAALDARQAAHVRSTASTRPHPYLDDKVLTAWNGLMIAAFARAARVVGSYGQDGSRRISAAARRAASFIRDRMWNGGNGARCCAATAAARRASRPTRRTTRT